MEEDGLAPDRRIYWARRLRRLRLDDSPLPRQVERLKGVTWTLTILSTIVGSIVFAILTAFRAPIVGLIAAGALIVPIVSAAWLDFGRISRDVRRFEAEKRPFELRN